MKEYIGIALVIIGIFCILGIFFLIGPVLGGQQITTLIFSSVVVFLFVSFVILMLGFKIIKEG